MNVDIKTPRLDLTIALEKYVGYEHATDLGDAIEILIRAHVARCYFDKTPYPPIESVVQEQYIEQLEKYLRLAADQLGVDSKLYADCRQLLAEKLLL